MTVIPPYQPGESAGDYVISVIRTAVPALWAMLVTFLVSLIPGVHDFVTAGTLINYGVPLTALVLAGWYALVRKFEPKLPAWLTVLLLGSNKTPTYLSPGQIVVPSGPGAIVVPPGAAQVDGRAN